MLGYLVFAAFTMGVVLLVLVSISKIQREVLTYLSCGFLAAMVIAFHLCWSGEYDVIPNRYCIALFLEDKFYEWITALSLLCGAILVGFSVRKSDSRPSQILMYVVALVLLLIGLEEISWGQRIFGWDTPAPLTALNVQDETNLHNIFPLGAAYLAISLYFVTGVATIFSGKLASCSQVKKMRLQKLLPPQDFRWFGFILVLTAIYSWQFHSEPGEIIFAIFSLNYGVYVWTSRKDKGQKTSTDHTPADCTKPEKVGT